MTVQEFRGVEDGIATCTLCSGSGTVNYHLRTGVFIM